MSKCFCRAAVLALAAGTFGQMSLLAQSAQPSASQSIDGELLRDPTRPFAALSSSRISSGNDNGGDRLLPDLGLSRSNYGVTFVRDGGASPLAVINGQRVTVGDLVDGATVLAISSAGVTLSVNGLEQVVNTFGPTVKEVSGTEF